MALAQNIAVVFLTMISLFGAVSMAAVYNVGDAAGWTSLGAVDYQKWAHHNDFQVGDTLGNAVFNYNNQYHNVKQVSQKDFLSCDARSSVATYASGSDSITLQTAGYYYFLCGVAGHCEAGQKVEILVTPTPLRPTIPSTEVLPPSTSAPTTSASPESPPTIITNDDNSAAPSLYSSNCLFLFTVLVFSLTGLAF